MIKKIFILIFLCSLYGETFSQKKVESKKNSLTDELCVATPAMCAAHMKVDDIPKKGSERDKVGDKKWVVYSDRDNNQTYYDLACTAYPYLKINFMEVFLVAEETDDAIRIVRFDLGNKPIKNKDGSKKRELVFNESADKEDCGWIKKRKMLLSSQCLQNAETKYLAKAICAKRIGKNQNDANLYKGDQIADIYSSPVAQAEYLQENNGINMFQYLFVMKKDKESNMILVSQSNKLSYNQARTLVYGWVSLEQVIEWNFASCLRVNFDTQAKAERKKKNREIKFFEDDNEAAKYHNGTDVEGLPFEFDETEKKDNPYYLGFPIFVEQGSTAHTISTGYVTDTKDKKGQSIFSAQAFGDINKKKADQIKKLKQINIVFVVDGAFRSKLKMIKSILDQFSYIGSDADASANKYSIGAVIYNDNKCQTLFDIIDLASFSEKQKGLFITKGSSDECQIERDDNGTPMYSAITRACNMFRESSESNVICLLGSASDRNSADRSKALSALIEKEVRLNFFQQSNGDGSIYDNFISDSQEFIEAIANGFDSKYSIIKDQVQSGALSTPKMIAQNGYATLKNSGATGYVYWKNKGEEFDQPELKDKIQRLVKDVEIFATKMVDKLENNVSETNTKEVSDDDGSKKKMLAMLTKAGLTEADIKKYANNPNLKQVFLTGWTTDEIKGFEHPLLKKTLFMSEDEFKTLLGNFKDLGDIVEVGAMREILKNTLSNIIQQHLGAVDEKTYGDYTIDEVMQFQGIAPSKSKVFKYKIEDIANASKIKDAELDLIQKQFMQIYRNLQPLKNDPEYKIQIHNEIFYWVPLDKFNFNE